MITGLLAVGALLFLPAGSFSYWQAWLLIAILFIPMITAGCIMKVKAPDLLHKRLNAREDQQEQKTVVALSAVMFVASFIVAGLNYRFQWLVLPARSSWATAAVFLVGYALYAEVMRENAYLSRTVEVQEDQRVVDTGLYGAVRHPMYLATLIMFLNMPLVLGSPISLLLMLIYIPIIVKRIKNEEILLERELEGYAEYKQRVRYRLVPYIW